MQSGGLKPKLQNKSASGQTMGVKGERTENIKAKVSARILKFT